MNDSVFRRVATLIGLIALPVVPVTGEAAPLHESAKILTCDWGFAGGVTPRSPPPGYDFMLAVAVVEIHNATELHNVNVTGFTLSDHHETVGRMKHVLEASVFDDPPYPAKGLKDVGYIAYYLDFGRTHPWNGTLPRGTIRLRIRAGFGFEDVGDAEKCAITVGPYKVTGAVTGSWPSG